MKYALLLLLLIPRQDPHLLQDMTSIPLDGPAEFAFADLDGDGKRDLVALVDLKADGRPTDSTLHWYTQGPALGFKEAGKLKLPDAAPHSMVLTKNEGIEVITGFYESSGAGRYAWQKGGFKGAGRLGSSTCPGIIQCADVNGDKRDDLLFAPAFEGAKQTQLVVEVLVSTKNGYTSVKERVDLGAFPTALGSGDFNKDKKRDLAVGFPGALQLYLGSGDGTFKKGGRVAVPTRPGAPNPNLVKPLSIATADLNGDGVDDVMVGCEGSWNLCTYLSDGKGGLTLAENLEVKGAAAHMVACDWNGDGFADVWIHCTGIKAIFQLFLGDGKGAMKPAGSISQPGFATWIAALDIDGEPGLEFVAGFEKMQTMDGSMGKDEIIFYKPGAK